MKQLIFLCILVLAGTAGTFLFNPFWGVAVYYLFAVLRPQFLWQWALSSYVSSTFPWSFYVAVCTILAAVGQKLGMLSLIPSDAPVGPRGMRLRPVHWGVCAFAFWTLVSYMCARSEPEAFACLIEYVKIFVMFFVSVYLIHSLHQLWTLLVIAALALAFVGYEVNFTYLQTRRITIYDSGFSGLDNNGAGLMLAMGVPLCLFVWEGTARWWRWAFAAFIPVLVHAVLMSFSRGAMVALLAVCPLCYLRSRYKVYLTLAVVGMSLIVPIMAGKEIRARFFSIEQFEKDGSAKSRFNSWAAAYRVASDNPFVGVGLRNVNLVSKEYGADFQGRTIHSQYFQIAGDMGFVGLALYLAMLGSVWYSLRSSQRLLKFRDDPEARQARAIANGVECGMVVFCVGATFLSLEVFELPYLLLLLGSQLAAILESRVRRA
jgi:probable O-glycosylation ligase (exosortase A-associated)